MKKRKKNTFPGPPGQDVYPQTHSPSPRLPSRSCLSQPCNPPMCRQSKHWLKSPSRGSGVWTDVLFQKGRQDKQSPGSRVANTERKPLLEINGGLIPGCPLQGENQCVFQGRDGPTRGIVSYSEDGPRDCSSRATRTLPDLGAGWRCVSTP